MQSFCHFYNSSLGLQKEQGGKIAFRLSENWTPWRVPWSRSRAPPRVAEARARRRTTLALHKPAQVHPGQPQRPQLFGNGRVFDELTIAANSSSTHVPRLGRRSSCPLLRLTGYPPQQRDGTYLGGSPTPQVRPLLTISARAGGAYDAGRSSKNLHETRGNSAAAFLARC